MVFARLPAILAATEAGAARDWGRMAWTAASPRVRAVSRGVAAGAGPETDALSKKMMSFADGAPTFHNLDVVEDVS
jgi:hypothetical protein